MRSILRPIRTSGRHKASVLHRAHRFSELVVDAHGVFQRFEEYITGFKSFNEHQKPRREWQNGQEGKTSAYILSSQMFAKRTFYTRKKEKDIKYPLHEWVEEATKPGSEYFPNPDKPVLLFPRNGELRPIEESDVPSIKLGDLVWLSFQVEFFIGAQFWGTTFIPREIVRVARVSPELLGDLKGFEFDELDVEDNQLGVGYKFSIGEHGGLIIQQCLTVR